MIDSDAALLDRFRRGDAEAFELLFLRHYNQVYRVVYSLAGGREQAEDVAQDTFLALHQQPPQLASDLSLAAWLCRVALNRGYNLLRGEQRSRERVERIGRLELPHVLDPEAEVVRAEEQGQVQAAIATLPERQAKLLLLRHAGLSYAEIAAALETAPGSVGTLLARAEKAFVAAYERMQPTHAV